MHDAFAREHAAAIAHERAAQGSFIEPHCNLIRKSGKDAARDRAGFGFTLLDIEALGARDGEKLLPELRRLARSAAMHPKAGTPPRIEVVFFREAKSPEQDKKIGFVVAPEEVIALVTHLFSFGAPQDVAALGKRCDESDAAHATLLLRGEEHARITRVNGEGEHPAA